MSSVTSMIPNSFLQSIVSHIQRSDLCNKMKIQTQNSLAIFETYGIRRIYDEQKETWYFSVVLTLDERLDILIDK